MNSLTRLIGLGSIAALLALPTSAALADDSDIFGANIQPNVVIMIDNSGSMEDEIQAVRDNINDSFAALIEASASAKGPALMQAAIAALQSISTSPRRADRRSRSTFPA